MLPRTIKELSAALAAAFLLLALGVPARADSFSQKLPPCSPCYQPYFGYYGTCWRPFPPGWVNCPCQTMPTVAGRQPDGENIPGRPRTLNGEEPEPIPPPRPDPNPVLQNRGFYLMRLFGR